MWKPWLKPEGETKEANPFTLDALIAWLEKQPAEKTYNIFDASRCLFGQFGCCEPDHNKINRMFGIKDIHYIGWSYPNTFGAALERARNLRACAMS